MYSIMYRQVSLLETVILQNKNSLSQKYIERMYMAETSKTKEYEGRKLVGFSMEQIYDVVADVQNYKEFVPFCKRSHVFSKSDDTLKANLVIGFPPVTESYSSKVTMIRPHFVKAECTDGKLFNHLNTLWLFSPGLNNNAQTQMENAFLQEARRRYGRPCIKTVRLER